MQNNQSEDFQAFAETCERVLGMRLDWMVTNAGIVNDGYVEQDGVKWATKKDTGFRTVVLTGERVVEVKDAKSQTAGDTSAGTQ